MKKYFCTRNRQDLTELKSNEKYIDLSDDEVLELCRKEVDTAISTEFLELLDLCVVESEIYVLQKGCDVGVADYSHYIKLIHLLDANGSYDDEIYYAKKALNVKYDEIVMEFLHETYLKIGCNDLDTFIDKLLYCEDKFELFKYGALLEYKWSIKMHTFYSDCFYRLSYLAGLPHYKLPYVEKSYDGKHECDIELDYNHIMDSHIKLLRENTRINTELEKTKTHILQLQSLPGGEIYEAAKKEFYKFGEFCEEDEQGKPKLEILIFKERPDYYDIFEKDGLILHLPEDELKEYVRFYSELK